jgi:A/G-specific adenine glycosylase
MTENQQFNFSNPQDVKAFRKHIYSYFKEYGRTLPWRTEYNPYHIYISEVMLQQTQVDRVIPKFELFIKEFPDFKTLANSRLEDVYSVWQGLGYNRRAASLRDAAKIIHTKYCSQLPDDPQELITLPGIGAATAASITAFAFNKPVLFLETNIRTVYIHHFFANTESISDSQILPLAQTALDIKNPRTWYSALMDYGTMLKKKYGNLTRKSSTYTKQTPFIGSHRQMRGTVLKQILEHKKLPISAIEKLTGYKQLVLREILDQLIDENFVKESQSIYSIAD